MHGLLDLYAELPRGRRGVHMSRMVEVAHEFNGKEWQSIFNYFELLTSALAQRQGLSNGSIRFKGQTTALRKTPVTARQSPDTFHIEMRTDFSNGEFKHLLGLGATIMTACPCTQAFSRYSTIAMLAETVGIEKANEIGFAMPTYTHSQRGELWLRFDTDGGIGLSQAYRAMESGAHLTFELLKRPDEHALVRRAHANPQFTEDVVREVAAQLVIANDGAFTGHSAISVSCRNIESIHGHDAYSEVAACASQIKRDVNNEP